MDELLWDYDANSSYPSAMWDEIGIYPRIENCYAFTPDMNDKLVKKFNTGNFTKRSAILKINYYNPKNLIAQYLPVKSVKRKLKLIVWEMVI